MGLIQKTDSSRIKKKKKSGLLLENFETSKQQNGSDYSKKKIGLQNIANFGSIIKTNLSQGAQEKALKTFMKIPAIAVGLPLVATRPLALVKGDVLIGLLVVNVVDGDGRQVSGDSYRQRSVQDGRADASFERRHLA